MSDDLSNATVDVWLDPSCPWSWLTAEWLHEVERSAGLRVRWHVMSLAILNEGQDLPPQWAEAISLSRGAVRVLAAATVIEGEQAFWPLLNAFAQRYHVQGRRDVAVLLDEAVRECGLPDTVATAAWVDDMDELVALEHKHAMSLGGNDVGSPIIGYPTSDGEVVGFYGPIISRVPRGAEAVRLFQAARALATTPGFFELKRTRDEEPMLG